MADEEKDVTCKPGRIKSITSLGLKRPIRLHFDDVTDIVRGKEAGHMAHITVYNVYRTVYNCETHLWKVIYPHGHVIEYFDPEENSGLINP